jgi:hypothetical protein
MGLPFLKTNGLFAKDADGRLLFFATPTAKSAYVVPDFGREDALRTLSKYWGLCELFSVALVAPIALHFGGPAGLLLAFAVFAAGSPIGYHFALKELLSGLESVIHEPLDHDLHTQSLPSLLRTVADETHAGLLWLCEAVSIVPVMGALLMLLNAHRAHHVAGALVAIVFFGSASIAGAYMISMKRRGIVVTETHSFPQRSAVMGR